MDLILSHIVSQTLGGTNCLILDLSDSAYYQMVLQQDANNNVSQHSYSTFYEPLRMIIALLVAVGCPDIAQPDGTILKRHGDRVEVRCRSSDQKWERHCVANEWVGELGTCPDRRSDVTPNPEGVLSVGTF